MGTNLKGKEIGKGISQRADGDYCARVTDSQGKRHQKRFRTLAEAKEWIATVDFDNDKGITNYDTVTMDKWFNIWLNDIKKDTIVSTTYNRLLLGYNSHIKDVVGDMKVRAIKQMDCQKIINNMIDKENKASSIEILKIELNSILASAVDNGIILKNPCTNINMPKKNKIERRVLTIAEQKQFVEHLQEHKCIHKDMFLFILETGIRIGEALGLQWSDVNFERKEIYISHNLVFNRMTKENEMHEPKTNAGKRCIPLTTNAIAILKRKKKNRPLVITDWTNNVFVKQDGTMSSADSCTKMLFHIARAMGVPDFSCHTLRHTFATRCIESGMKPKTLQKILGHSDITMTMNLYVHITEDEVVNEMRKFEIYAI